ncbi:hypothetical protein OF846_000978 [Rhodotorula toruloides]|nr:hypothetical protein OF846_000978 [Rhodotorula toruloides]
MSAYCMFRLNAIKALRYISTVGRHHEHEERCDWAPDTCPCCHELHAKQCLKAHVRTCVLEKCAHRFRWTPRTRKKRAGFANHLIPLVLSIMLFCAISATARKLKEGRASVALSQP